MMMIGLGQGFGVSVTSPSSLMWLGFALAGLASADSRPANNKPADNALIRTLSAGLGWLFRAANVTAWL